MQSTEIILIRHGETDWNAERRLQGFIDIALNARGRQQAAALAAALSGTPVDAIFSSDLCRALSTAEAVAATRGMPVRVDAGLRERCFGALEGLRHDDIRERFPQAYLAWQSRSETFPFPPGSNPAETLAAFAARAIRALRRVAGDFPGGRVVVVSHGGVLDCLYREAVGVPQSDRQIVEKRNAAINRLSYDGDRFHVLAWGDTTHLSKPALDEIG